VNHARGRGTGAQVEATELCDLKAMADIRRAEAQMRDGEVYDEAQVRAALKARRR